MVMIFCLPGAIFATNVTEITEFVHRVLPGESLNKIAGQRVYKGSFGGMGVQASGNFDEAVEWFRDWWKAHEAQLTFDRETGRWKLP